MNSKLKKYWLISSIIYLGSQLIDVFVGDPSMTCELGLIFLTLVIPFGYLLIESLNFFGLYWFSYRKQGTLLLTVNMVLALFRLGVLLSPLLYWHELTSRYADQTNRSLLIDALVTCVYLLIMAQWLVFSFKVRKENKLIRMNEMLSHPEYQTSVEELKAVDTLDDLTLIYGESVRKHPQIAPVLKKIYEQRRFDLSKAD